MTAPLAPAERWRRLPVAARATVAVISLLVAFNLVLAGIDLVVGGPAPGGPPSSSYATASAGLAAYAELLADHGHPVRRLRTTLDRASLDTAGTVVVADPGSLTRAEQRAVRRFVDGGGRLIAAGRSAVPLLRGVLGRAPEWAPGAQRSARPLVPVAEVAAVSQVRLPGSGAGSWEDAGASLPILAGRGDAAPVLATVASVGRGRVVALADASVLHNALLSQADNAAFGLAAAGQRSRPVAFAEAAHGYGPSEGIGAIPGRWRLALLGAVVATLVWMWSRGRRLGPPEDAERPAPPPRAAYVAAMASSLARMRQPAAGVKPLQDAARRRLAARAGLPPEAGDDALRRAAVALGMAPEDVDQLLATPGHERDLVAVGRAVTAVPGLAEQESRW